MKKGFTLIELLAVIVLLAIIALIATPIVLGIINDAKKKAFIQTINEIIDATEYYYANEVLDGVKLIEEKNFYFPNEIKGLEFDGEVPKSGFLTININGKISFSLSNGNYCVTKGYDDINIVFEEDRQKCIVPYKEKILNGADPVLKPGMIAVTIDTNGTVKKADRSSSWYSYENKMWANAVTVTENTRDKYLKMDHGETINESDILTYFVWVPRYKYKLWYVDPTVTEDSVGSHSIDIVFENNEMEKSDGTCNGTYQQVTNGCYFTHPSFTFGEEVNGMWIGKFETGYNGATSKLESENGTGDLSKVIIKPNTYSWRNIRISSIFNMLLKMNDDNNIFGLTEESDTHMMKNTEWGATSYLSHSEYGTCISGDCTEVASNNCSFITGCGSDSSEYGTKIDGIYAQSTTGNISGIFDMSGGTGEYVMAYIDITSEQSGFTSTSLPADTKYIDKYDSENVSRILGDATGELGPFSEDKAISWYGDISKFLSGSQWFYRGSNAFYKTGNKGIFAFAPFTGGGRYYFTFRIVII